MQQNAPVSTEITGYALSALVSLGHFDRAATTARFLCRAWDADGQVMPFELGEPGFAYFFDSGIIVRGLLAAWRATDEQEFLDTAVDIGRHMSRDYDDGADFHPILTLPGKQPLERDPSRWSRSAGCYQLKAAMAFHDLAQAA